MMKRNRKRGSAARQTTINIRVTPWEREIIRRQAEAYGMTVSAYLIGLALGPDAEQRGPRDDPEDYYDSLL